MSNLSDFAHLFRFHAFLLDGAVGDFTPEQWNWRPAAGGNPAWWILGHVAFYRRRLLELLGCPADARALGDGFARGSTPGLNE